jgi:hypothetical protein
MNSSALHSIFTKIFGTSIYFNRMYWCKTLNLQLNSPEVFSPETYKVFIVIR